MLARRIPALSLRELLEASLGLKVSRLQVSRRGLDDLDYISRNTGIGACLADYKVITETNSGRGDLWSDRVVSHVGLDNACGDYLVYVAEDQKTAERARFLDARGDDDRFGELLAIPECCRAFYSCSVRDHLLEDLLWIVAERCQTPWRVPQGANVCAQYFERGFLSHFPCDLGCPKSRSVAKRRFIEIGQIFERFAEWLADGCKWSYLVFRQGIAALTVCPADDGSCRVANLIDTRGTVPIWVLQGDLSVVREGESNAHSTLRIDGGRADEVISIVTAEDW